MYYKFVLCMLLAFGAWGQQDLAHGESIRVMSFNIWVGGESGRQPLEQTAKVIRESGADIVGMQEALGRERNGVRPDNGKKIAALLGWEYVAQGGGRAILSRYEILGLTPDRQGAEIRLPSGESCYLFNVHLNHAPYQPYQVLNIPYADAPFLETAEELVGAANAARGDEIQAALDEIEPLLSKDIPVFLTGDFNEPSHQDWTERAHGAGLVPLVVAYPTTRSVVKTGMLDAYRAVYPDEVKSRGLTWTPTTSIRDPKDRHDRIDFVFVSPGITVEACQIVGKHKKFADILVKPFPSDHRAVVAKVTVK